ncbi:Hypothetical protein NTJ_09619 [Nesidiocoris tenuis]|nr:Hypothetical protein NTJ_09619 [Nesidiocoris tenuis]
MSAGSTAGMGERYLFAESCIRGCPSNLLCRRDTVTGGSSGHPFPLRLVSNSDCGAMRYLACPAGPAAPGGRIRMSVCQVLLFAAAPTAAPFCYLGFLNTAASSMRSRRRAAASAMFPRSRS